MIRKVIKGGYRRKPDMWSYVLSNEDLMSIGKTEDIPTFVTRMQRNYAAHIIRKDNTSILKRAMFNDDDRRRTGPTLTLLKKAIAHEGLSWINFFQNTLNRIY